MKTLLECVNSYLPFVKVVRKDTKTVRAGCRFVVAFYDPDIKAIVLSRKTGIVITDTFIFVHEVGHALFDTWRIPEDNLVEEMMIRRFVLLLFGFRTEDANDAIVQFWRNWKADHLLSEDPDMMRVIDGSDALMRTDLAQDLKKLVHDCADIGI